MFNDYSTDNNYRAPSALAVAARAYEMEKQWRLEYDLERARLLTAQERAGARGTGGAGAIHQPWYSAAQQWLQQWLKEKVLYRGLAAGRPIAAGKSR